MDNFLTGRPVNVADLIGERFRLVNVNVTDFIHAPGPLDAVLHFASPASPIDYLKYPIQTLKVAPSAPTTPSAWPRTSRPASCSPRPSSARSTATPRSTPQPETYWGHVNPIGPRGVYDEAKRFAEALAMAYHRSHGVPVRIARDLQHVRPFDED